MRTTDIAEPGIRADIERSLGRIRRERVDDNRIREARAPYGTGEYDTHADRVSLVEYWLDQGLLEVIVIERITADGLVSPCGKRLLVTSCSHESTEDCYVLGECLGRADDESGVEAIIRERLTALIYASDWQD